MKKNYVTIAVGVVALLVGLGVGYVVHQPQSPSAGFGSGLPGAMGRRGATGGSGNTFVDGQIIAMDATSLTLQLRNGNSQIVFYSTSTPILKMTSGTVSDLAEQKEVVVTGTQNPDGSVTAQSIQLRSQGIPGVFGAGH